jgi:hypothetical protein
LHPKGEPDTETDGSVYIPPPAVVVQLGQAPPCQEWGAGYDKKVDSFTQASNEKARKYGRTVISVKHDWKRVFAFEQ